MTSCMELSQFWEGCEFLIIYEISKESQDDPRKNFKQTYP